MNGVAFGGKLYDRSSVEESCSSAVGGVFRLFPSEENKDSDSVAPSTLTFCSSSAKRTNSGLLGLCLRQQSEPPGVDVDAKLLLVRAGALVAGRVIGDVLAPYPHFDDVAAPFQSTQLGEQLDWQRPRCLHLPTLEQESQELGTLDSVEMQILSMVMKLARAGLGSKYWSRSQVGVASAVACTSLFES
jgi:hypothetical protein